MKVLNAQLVALLVCASFAAHTPAVRADAIVGPQVRVDQTNELAAGETAIVASLLDPLEVLAGAMDFRNGENIQLGYGVSLDGGKTWLDGVLVSPPELGDLNHADPMIATDPLTGDFWIGAITLGSDGTNNGVFVARKPAGSTIFEPSVVVSNTLDTERFDDKPLMAAGLDPFDAEQTNVYVTWSRFDDPGALPPIMVARSFDGGATWSDPIATGAIGQGAAPVVLSDGRLVMGYSNFEVGEIFVVYSDDAGATWSLPVSVSGVIDWVQESDIPGGFRIPTLPGIAVDPSNDDLYVAYQARSEIGSRNIDVFIGRSSDGGESFQTVVRLAESNPAGDQFFPWVAVDTLGGVNVLWYDTRNVDQPDNSSEAWLDAYYARLTDFGSQNQRVEEHRLTSVTFNTNFDFGHAWIGDYQQITASGTTVYPCYQSTHLGHQNIFAHRIEVFATSDLDHDGDVDPADFEIYLNCLGGPNVPPPGPACLHADLDDDNDVDFADFDVLQLEFTGPL